MLIPENNQEENSQKKFNPLMPLYFALILALGVGIGYYFTFNANFSATQTAFSKQTNGSKINNLLDYVALWNTT